jgi:hypothetical protein
MRNMHEKPGERMATQPAPLHGWGTASPGAKQNESGHESGRAT